MTTAQMKIEMVQRLDNSLQSFRSAMNALDALDRLEDYDLIDQMVTAENLMADMDQLITRINSIVRK